MRGDFRTIILTMGLTMNFLINGKKETEHGTGRGRAFHHESCLVWEEDIRAKCH
jgi:hypothetical protein